MAFNTSQVNAVDHFLGPMLVLAGPGSGKTTVITHRTQKLIREYGVDPKNILVITFTKAAAVQMQERFCLLMGQKGSGSVTFGTFHAVYFKILKYAYNYSASNILKEEMKYDIIREIINYLKMDISDEKEFISDIISEIGMVKGDMMDIDHYYSKNCSESYFKKIYEMYNEKLIRSNLIDFDDMLVMCYELLTKRPDILKLWQDKYKFILIDEFQDISKVQYEIIKLLAMPENNIFIVGDDDQSIYRFRGAKPEIMLNFKKDFENAKEVLLDVNYRSTGNIVRNSIALINHNKVRFSKKIKYSKDEGDDIRLCPMDNQIEESKYIINQISELTKSGEEYKDIAILYRTNTNPRVLVEKLIEYNIPFRMKDSIPNLYEHFLAKNIISYIKIAMGDDSRKEYLSIINKPKRYISREAFSTPLVDLDDIRQFYEDKEYVVERIDRFVYDIMMLEKMTPFAAISYIRNGIGYDDYVKEYASYRRINERELFDVLDEISEGARGYKTYAEWFAHISQYTEELKRQVNKRNDETNSVELSTMHSAKGLEYNNVIILGVNEGTTPHKKAVLDSDIEEERRLFYVAMTRAKKKLYITYVKEKYGKKIKPSRFIKDILGEENTNENNTK